MREGEKKYKYDIIADQILEEIRKDRREVRDRLPPKTELASEFCVNRVCLRKGLERLNVLGIVKTMQDDSTYVNEVSPSGFIKPLFNPLTVMENNIDKICNARLFAENRACRLVAKNKTEEKIKVLGRYLDNMEEATAFNEFTSYSKYDRKSHDLLISAPKSQVLALIPQMLSDVAQRYTDRLNRDPKIVSRSIIDHRQLFGVVEGEDGDSACHVMQVHSERSRKALLDIEHSEQPVLPFRMRRKGNAILGELLARPTT